MKVDARIAGGVAALALAVGFALSPGHAPAQHLESCNECGDVVRTYANQQIMRAINAQKAPPAKPAPKAKAPAPVVGPVKKAKAPK